MSETTNEQIATDAPDDVEGHGITHPVVEDSDDVEGHGVGHPVFETADDTER